MSLQFNDQQRQALGMGNQAAAQRERYFAELGRELFDRVMVRLFAMLNEEQFVALGHTIDSCDSFETVLSYLEQTYPAFRTFMAEEVQMLARDISNDIMKGGA